MVTAPIFSTSKMLILRIVMPLQCKHWVAEYATMRTPLGQCLLYALLGAMHHEELSIRRTTMGCVHRKDSTRHGWYL